jgi:pyruvate dehydrogenase E2 component (dihydrolipoamide acetyltransferase)
VGSKGLAAISAETKALAGRAREGKLKPEEYQGGSFTISNLGMFGIKTSPKIEVDASTEKGWKEVSIMKATLSSDHRTVDGAVGARWLKAFKEYMEQPLTFML